MKKTLLCVSPHPDDELLGAGSTMHVLQQEGWDIINLACSLGRVADHERRGKELEEASKRAGYRTIIISPPVQIARMDDYRLARQQITDTLSSLLLSEQPSIVVSPQPYDGHHGHEIVAQTVQDTLQNNAPEGLVWWQWGWWRELSHPTLYVPFGEGTLTHVEHALEAYTGENARNNYVEAYKAKAVLQAVLGSERIFGYGASSASELPYAELLTEKTWSGSAWIPGSPRILREEFPIMTHTDELDSGND